MKIECIQKVGEVQIQRIYTFDASLEDDVRVVKETLSCAFEDVEDFPNETKPEQV